MKRSQINQIVREAETFFRQHQFKLPPFASWTPSDWLEYGEDRTEILRCELGWDVTDFGCGNFEREGLLLFTIRNGCVGSRDYPKPYAEKIMISRAGQLTLLHCHLQKTEDIINRGGGNLVFELYNRKAAKELAETPVTLSVDGIRTTISAGQRVILKPGESICLTPGIFHQFQAEVGHGDVLIGEVSSVNDDHNDNVFYREQVRFPEIIEDEAVYRLLVSDYASNLVATKHHIENTGADKRP